MTDRRILSQHRARATEMFLQDAAADDVQERLIEVNRTFTSPAVVTGFPDLWTARMPNAQVVG
ncbi:SAM-dependent methyltransferase, partial [Octadecabacter sp.]|nr:SAM-dependent methyltransferase [Octadecabacter sp.]